MPRTTHLNSLQALELSIREGSLQAAAHRLGITPAAVGQRIRALEQYLDTDLVLRGRSGLRPTPALEAALDDLQVAFAALDRVSDRLDFQRTAEIHVVADPDWSDLWLRPRLEQFQQEHPNIHFNVNGEGDVPIRLGAADVTIDRDPAGRARDGNTLYHEVFLPIGSPETAGRISDPFMTTKGDGTPKYLPVGTLSTSQGNWRHSEVGSLEGFPLLHISPRADAPETPSWSDWLAAYPYERTSPDRGVKYALVRNALEGVKSDAGLLVCGLSCILEGIDTGALSLPFPPHKSLEAKYPYRYKVRNEIRSRPQVLRFIDWLENEAEKTEADIRARCSIW